MKVLFITNIPSPYRVKFFEELGRRCKLTVLFEKEISLDRDESWKTHEFNAFQGIFLKNKGLFGRDFCPDVKKYLGLKWDIIICQNISTLTGIYEIFILKKRNIKYFIEVDGGFAKDGHGIKEVLKKIIISKANGYFSTAKETDRYLLTYGANPNLIYRYPFSSISSDEIIQKPLSFKEKKLLKERLGLPKKPVVLSVGQFIYRKGFDILLRSIQEIEEDISYVIVGGSPNEEYYRLIPDNKRADVIFRSFMQPELLRDYFLAADIFVLPTREDIWGLVINEAMAYGLPVITTNRCIAGLEMVVDGYNGYIIPSESIKDLSKSITSLLKSDLYEISNNSLMISRNYTVERMVEAHMKIIGDGND